MALRFRALGVALALALPLPLLMGCAVGAGLFEPFAGLMPDTMPDIENSVITYNNDLRWGRLRQASSAVAPDQRDKFFELFDQSSSGFHFTSVEVLSTEPAPRKALIGDGETEPLVPREYDVLVAFEYYRLPGLDERKLRQKQTWRYLPLDNRWEVEPDFAGFEAALAPEHRDAGEPVPAAPER